MSEIIELKKHRVDVASRYSLLPPTPKELACLAKKARPANPDAQVEPKEEYIARNLRRRLGPDAIRELVARYNGGEHTTDLSKEFDISRTGLRRLLLAEGVKFRRQPMTESDIRRAVRLYESGLTIRQVVKRVGYSFNTVRQALNEEGVTMRSARVVRRSDSVKS